MSIYYTYTDESPALATTSLYPIFEAFLKTADIKLENTDISLAARVLALFAKADDDLSKLAKLTKDKNAIIIKTPNISASIPQLKATIKELQAKGYNVPSYPDEPKNEEEKELFTKYQSVLGSAVNPVLRDGNSDRRSTNAVKKYAQANPYKVKAFDAGKKSRISSMDSGDFYESEKAFISKKDEKLKLLFNGECVKEIAVLKGEQVATSCMDVAKLSAFYDEQREVCEKEGLLYSLHLKATMMKISDPYIFSFGLKSFFKEEFALYKNELDTLGINPNNGLKELLSKIENSAKKDEIKAAFLSRLKSTPISMVDSDKGISNLHVPSDVIIDASMPAMLKNGALLWDINGAEKPTNALIPDRCYAGIYKAVLDDIKANGMLDPAKIGSVSNVGLMAKKAQEYGSHDKTFIAPNDGKYELVGSEGLLLAQDVKKGDIYRICLAKPDAVANWIELALDRVKESGEQGIFFLDEKRQGDALMIEQIKPLIKGSDIKILEPYAATKECLKLIREGKNAISISGNVLRDYLTDLFPILELGTSAKMLSIVPMLSGGAMFETGAGGSAPKQVSQLVEENHLRWDSLGEFLAMQAALEFYAKKFKNEKAGVLATAMDKAIKRILDEGKSPSRKVGEHDNRSSHFFLTYFMCYFLSQQNEDLELNSHFKQILNNISENKDKIEKDFLEVQGKKVDLGGYYLLDSKKAEEIMRPVEAFNTIINNIKESK